MKILIAGDTAGGVFTYVCELAPALAERGVETTLALMGPRPTSDQRRALARCGAERVHAQDFALEWMDDPWRDVERAGDWLLELAAGAEPDVVHLNGYAHGALPWDAPVLVVGHSCVLSWYQAVTGGAAPARWDRYRREVERGLRAASLLAAPTAAMLRELVRLYGVRGPAAVIPNGRTAVRPGRAKQPYVLAAGRLWDEAKNLAALDRAAGKVEWPVLVAGDDPPSRPQHAWLLGRVADAELAERMACASIFAAPALYEPFGLAPLEAGLAGCALVLGDISSLREVWGDDAALYVDPHDGDALAAALSLLIRDRALRAELGRAARERAERYTPDRMARGYLEVYEQLVTEALAAPDRIVAAG